MSALPSVPATEPPSVSISTDPARLDVPWVCAAMRSLPGGEMLVDGQCRQALHGSLVFGAHLGPVSEHSDAHGPLASGHFRQIGFVRVVTDGAIFSSVTDVFVDPAHRGKGIGTSLMKAVVEHPAVAGTRCILQARQNAWVFYWRTGDFKVFDRQHGMMLRMPR